MTSTTTHNQRHIRILKGALSIADNAAATEDERRHWSEKADQLAEKYGLHDALEAWRNGTRTDTSASTSWVCAESVYVAQEEVVWADSVMSGLAALFDCRVIRREVSRDRDHDALGDDMELFAAYDFIADENNTRAAEAAAFVLSTSIHELMDVGSLSEENIAFFVNQFCNSIASTSQNAGSQLALLRDSDEINEYLSYNYGVTSKSIVRSRANFDPTSKDDEDKLRVEAFLNTKKMKEQIR